MDAGRRQVRDRRALTPRGAVARRVLSLPILGFGAFLLIGVTNLAIGSLAHGGTARATLFHGALTSVVLTIGLLIWGRPYRFFVAGVVTAGAGGIFGLLAVTMLGLMARPSGLNPNAIHASGAALTAKWTAVAAVAMILVGVYLVAQGVRKERRT